MTDPLLENLTEAQREAVLHVDGPLLVLAGPGSGKTRVITHRIAHLLRCDISSRNILALTFTNKAADEMKSRVEALAPGRGVWLGTFHRFCARMLRQYATLVGLGENFTIYDTSDSLAALKRALVVLDFDLGNYTPQQVAHAISTAKNNLITPAEYTARSGHPLESIVGRVYPAYQAQLLQSSAVDFDDLLLHFATLLRDNPEVRAELDDRWRYILVDEYQDTNLAQYAIVRALSVGAPNLCVTGDPDQSIYGWRGANLRNILDFENDYPEVHVVRLERNYRSTQYIVRAAARLISHNRRRKEKALFTHNDEGQPVRLMTYATHKSEAEAIAQRIAADVLAGRRRPCDFAVFYRINALSRTLEFAMRDHGIPYQIVNGVEFFHRKEIKDSLAYLSLANNPRDDVALLRVLNVPARGIGKTSLARLGEHAAERRLTLLEAARQSGIIPKMPKKAATALARFAALIDRLGAMADRPVEEILGHALEESGYRQQLAESTLPEDQERLANIEELLTAAREFDERSGNQGRLEEFLEESSLVNDTDNWLEAADRVTLMTLHASKGLEFPVVFLTAVEHGLLPHERSSESPEQLEEERRLLFVGITRAREELYLSMARYREFRGRSRLTVPSSFLFELPRDELAIEEERSPLGQFGSPRSALAYDEFSQEAPGDEALDDGATLADDALEFDIAAFDSAETELADSDSAAANPTSGSRTSAPSAAHSALGLTTAAELQATSGQAERRRCSPEVFHLGMVVRHAEYGLGKIVALSGSGERRSATVAFVTGAGEHTFILRHAALWPARGS